MQFNEFVLREEAGWATSRHDRVEAHPRVSVAELQRIGVVAHERDPDDGWGAVPFCSGVSASYYAERRRLVLHTKGFPNTVVEVEWRECPFGGFRPFLLCGECGSRKLALSRVGHVWACRKCHRLSYESQRLSDAKRARLRAQRIRRRYGSDDWRPLSPLPPKPWGMRLSRYVADRVELMEADLASERPVSRELERDAAEYIALLKGFVAPPDQSRSAAPQPRRRVSPASSRGC